jgi:hypothetical protein
MPDDRNDRDEYYPSFGTRMRWTFIIVSLILIAVLVGVTIFGD